MPRSRKAKDACEAPARPAPQTGDRDRLSRLVSNLLDLDRRQLLLQWRNQLRAAPPFQLFDPGTFTSSAPNDAELGNGIAPPQTRRRLRVLAAHQGPDWRTDHNGLR
jgi:hypothetical protein